MDLRQKELLDWQKTNFPVDELMSMSKEQLVQIILTMQMALGIAEEAGETCHHILKGIQKIRSGQGGVKVNQVVDGVADTLVYGLQLLSRLNVDAEVELPKIVDKVLERNWIMDPNGPEIVK